MIIRPIKKSDYYAWLPLWDGYNAYYERTGPTAIAPHITQTTWQRFFDPAEPMFALVAEIGGEVVGLAHYLFHRRTSTVEPICYLSDLFTVPSQRGKGVARALIEAVYAATLAAGSKRVYWQTNASNTAGRALYDKVAKHAGYIVYAADL